MAMILNPNPGIFTGSNISVNISTTPDIELFAITTDGIPPVIAKYIAYDNLSPANPFIATVEDGLGNILLDGGFPKWYNDNCNSSWATYSELSPVFKYLYDAIDFISNKTKVNNLNKKILILGDQEQESNYSIKDGDSGRGGFKLSIDTICRIKGYQPTYKTPRDYITNKLDANYQELDQYCCILFFSSNWTNSKLITNECIQSLIAYRENKNGIFFITDHGDRALSSISEAIDTDNFGFYRTANYVISNFGCYFSGNYDRSPVNVGFLRNAYGNHILWENLNDSDYIYAGGSESKVVTTTFPTYRENYNFTITEDGYTTIKILIQYLTGSIQSVVYTYGKNIQESIYMLNSLNEPILEQHKSTFLRKQPANIKIEFDSDVTGMLKFDSIPIGTFNYNKLINKTTKQFYSGFSNNLTINSQHVLDVQMLTPIQYLKSLTWKFETPNFDYIRASKTLNFLNNFEFKNFKTSSPFRNLNTIPCNPNLITGHFENKFQYKKIYNYFKNIDQVEIIDTKLISPIIPALIYDDSNQIQFELSNRRPQTPLDIFNNWGRFDGESYYDNKLVATGNAAAWVYDATSGTVQMPLNVEPTNGLVSNLEYDNYEFSATMAAFSNDDDAVGLVAAFSREGSRNFYITFVATMGGLAPSTGIGVYFNYIRSTDHVALWQNTITTYRNGTGNGWQGRTVRLKIKRVKDIIYFWHSQTDSEVLPTDPQFELDLNSNPILNRFKGKKKYGYMTLSEPSSTYKNIEFAGGLNTNLLIDALSNATYEYNTTSGSWVQTNLDLLATYGSGVLVYNPEQTDPTKKYFYKFTTTSVLKYGPYVEQNSTSGINFDKSLVFITSIANFTTPTGNKIKKIWLEYETDILRDLVFNISYTINGQIITFANPTRFNLHNAIILTNNNELYKLTESGINFIIENIIEFKYINYN